jgi:hypothetical protein
MISARILRFAAVLTGTVVALAACSGSADPIGTRTPTAHAPSVSAVTTAPAEDVGPTKPPSTLPQVPDGVYRTSLTKDQVSTAGGSDPSAAGTWTLTLNRRTYQLECAWVDNDGDDCGHSGRKTATVEAGTAAGDANYLWLEYSKSATVKITGAAEGAPDDYAYRVTWKLQGRDLVMSAVWAEPSSGWNPGDVNAHTIKPWKRIG